MKKLIYNCIKYLVIFFSRRDIDIKKYQKKILFSFIAVFVITALDFSFNVTGSIVGLSVSVSNITLLFIEIVSFGLLTYIFYLYYLWFDSIKYKYLIELFCNKQIHCAYGDDRFDSNFHTIETNKNGYGISNHHIHLSTGEIYRFDDSRAFKFVAVKDSRKLKLKKLKDIIKNKKNGYEAI